MVALAVVALIALAFPLSRSSASRISPDSSPVLAVADGLTAAIRSQAETLVGAMARATPAATPSDDALTRSLDGFPGASLVPRPLLAAAAGVMLQGALAGPEGGQGLSMSVQKPVRFTLHEGGLPSVVFSTRPTVGAALAALGAGQNPYDIVSPPPETRLTAGLHVFVNRATAVTLGVGGREPGTVYSHAETVGDLLTERGIELAGGDWVRPGVSAQLRPNMEIAVTLVGEKTLLEDTPLPFWTIYRDDPTLYEGESAVIQWGVDGYVRREYTVTYANGEEVRRELASEMVVPPTHHIIAVGTAPVFVAAPVPVPVPSSPPPAPSSDPDCARTLTVWATWYTAASAGGSGVTATGTVVQRGTVAVDPSVIPLGTRMYIPGYGYGVAEDTGGAIIGNMIDLGYGPNDVWDWSSRYVDICILG